MPGIVPFIPLIAAGLGAGVSAISQNAQNKAAIKNNETQQQAAVNNAQQSWQNAQKNYNTWAGANPSPVAGSTVAGPHPGAYGNYGGSPLAAQILGTTLGQGTNAAPGAGIRTSQDTTPSGQEMRRFLPPGPVSGATATPPPAIASAPASRGLLSLRQNPALLAQILGG